MATLTNRAGLPDPLFAAVARDDYSSPTLHTATSLILPPRIYQLRKRYQDQITEDASDRIWRLIGRIGHAILETAGNWDPLAALRQLKRTVSLIATHAEDPEASDLVQEILEKSTRLLERYTGLILERNLAPSLCEERFIARIEGEKISCGTDLYTWVQPKVAKNGSIRIRTVEPQIVDWKFTTRWVHGKPKPEWEQQLNINAWIIQANGYPVKKASIVAIYRDWMASEAERKKDYPQSMVHVFEIELWPFSKQEEFIRNRLLLHKAAELSPDELLPFCTPEEQWRTPTVYRIVKAGRKRALKTFSGPKASERAMTYAATVPNAVVDIVPGKPKRCLGYCDVRPFCNQFVHENPNYEEGKDE